MKTLTLIIGLGASALLLSSCSSTLYGVPKSEWKQMTPREQQMVMASGKPLNQTGTNAGVLEIFHKKPEATPEAAARADAAQGNN